MKIGEVFQGGLKLKASFWSFIFKISFKVIYPFYIVDQIWNDNVNLNKIASV